MTSVAVALNAQGNSEKRRGPGRPSDLSFEERQHRRWKKKAISDVKRRIRMRGLRENDIRRLTELRGVSKRPNKDIIPLTPLPVPLSEQWWATPEPQKPVPRPSPYVAGYVPPPGKYAYWLLSGTWKTRISA